MTSFPADNDRGHLTPTSRSEDKLQISNGSQFYNLNPLVHLIGEANEAPVYVDGVKCTALIDLGDQVPTIMTSFAKHLSLPIQPLRF